MTLLQESPLTAEIPLAWEARQLLYNLGFLTPRKLHFESTKSVQNQCSSLMF